MPYSPTADHGNSIEVGADQAGPLSMLVLYAGQHHWWGPEYTRVHGVDDVDETNAEQEQYVLTYDAMRRANITPGELWLHYFSMGGAVDEYEANAYLHGLIDLPEQERDCMSQAVNELFDDLCRQQGAPYSSGQRGRREG